MTDHHQDERHREDLSEERQARRDFLQKAGRFASITPPAIVLLLGTSLSSRSIAASNGTRPGWGRGDLNHTHTGPPGWTAGRRRGR